MTTRELPHISGDAKADERRREMDELIRTRITQTPEQKKIYKEWYNKQVFVSQEDREVFDKLPLSDIEKMEMIIEMRNEHSL